MKHYDLALIFVSFQRCCVYLSLVKELSNQYNIAICPQNPDKNTIIRTRNTIDEFLLLCQSYGADIIHDQTISADIEILPQTNYTKETIEHIKRTIKSKETYWLSGLAMGNVHYESLHGKKVDKILVVDRNFYNFRVNEYERGADKKFPEQDIVEIGMPYDKYPIFPDYDIDYIWANPTPFSFCNASDRLEYLENVNALIEKIDENDRIALKPHNADERVDYIVHHRIYAVLKSKIFSPFHSTLDRGARKFAMFIKHGPIRDFFVNISIAIMYVKLMRRVVRFSEVTERHNLNLELFLPNVKKGLITGRSNCIWHGLFNKKPVYNCIAENKKYFSDTKMHKYSMKYLNVHGNYDGLEFDRGLYDLIDAKTRNSDIVMFVKDQLQKEGLADEKAAGVG